MAKITVKKREKNQRIPDGLFGFNMEITRKTFWRGLSAQMLNNRKFYMGDENAPYGWECGNHKYEKDTVKSLCNSSYIVLYRGGYASYVSDSVNIKAESLYEISIWVDGSNEKRILSVRVGENEKIFDIEPSENKFVELKTVIKALKDTDEGCFAITLTHGNSINIYEASLMPKNNFYGMRQDVIEKLRTLRPTYLRFPGGCCTDHFDWKEGLKPIERRTPIDGRVKNFMFRDSYDQDCNDVGINEFIMLCRAVGAEPEYTIRLVLSDAEEARSLVEYCNGSKETYWGKVRESLGFEPFNIKLWYVGNEIYFFGYGLDHDAKEAARKTDEYIQAMKSADSDIKTIVGVCPHSDIHKQWSNEYIANIQSDYDYISYHRYNGTEIDSEVSDLLHADNVRTMIQDGKEAGFEYLENVTFKDCWDKINVNIDEWNYSWGLKGSTLMMLSNALFMQFMLKSFDKYHITDARFFHPVNEGMIDVSPADCVMDTSGELFKYYNMHRGGILLDAFSDNKELDVIATQHHNNRICSVVNRSKEKISFVLEDVEKCDGCELHITGIKIASVTAFQNETEKIDMWINGSESIKIPGNSIIFIEY